jgi:uncharacterized membrane protein
MSDLIAVAYDDEFKAERVRLDLLQMQREHLVDMEEAAVLVHRKDGKVKLHHVTHFTVPAALSPTSNGERPHCSLLLKRPNRKTY